MLQNSEQTAAWQYRSLVGLRGAFAILKPRGDDGMYYSFGSGVLRNDVTNDVTNPMDLKEG